MPVWGSSISVRVVTCAFVYGRGSWPGRLGDRVMAIDLRSDAVDLGPLCLWPSWGGKAKDVELLVLRRHVARPALRPADRILLAAGSRLLSLAWWSAFVITPATAGLPVRPSLRCPSV